MGNLSDSKGVNRLKTNLIWAAITTFLTALMLLVGRYLPPLTAFCFGMHLYTPAWFVYDANPVFDHTIMTWGTDYLIAALMLFGTLQLIAVRRTPTNNTLVLYSALLIGSYLGSTLFGALCHHFLAENLNGFMFKMVWRVCVGWVCLGCWFMGSVATEIAALSETQAIKDGTALKSHTLPVVPHYVWIVYGTTILIANSVGFFSMKQPACDIFCIGVTQAPNTLYLIAAMYSQRSWTSVNVSDNARRVLLFGMLFNFVLLPGYDVMNYMQLTDGVCNVILHTVLFISWGAQAYGLWHFCRGAATIEKGK
eukprot:GDKI01033007.1.p1 GENE.GDKI01033007.1~~GDKI01033007.1.p1  ORF type:complete len:309 (-),score=57.64 GDKI01033007.1:29-955(-)